MEPLAGFALTVTRPIPADPLVVSVHARLLWHRLWRPWRRLVYRWQMMRVLAAARGLRDRNDAWLDGALARLRDQTRRQRFPGRRATLIEALALLRELARRTLGQEPYSVQIMAALALYDGCLVQFAPGEGKTLTLGLVAVLRGWEPVPCHLITANEYLAARDVALLEPFFARAGLRASALRAEQTPEERRAAYAHDIVYATAKQLVADHLIDRIRFGGSIDRLGLSLHALLGREPPLLMQRGLGNAIVDEADYILVDEAITPMIISEPEPAPGLHAAVLGARRCVHALKAGQHYRLAPGEREVLWLQAGVAELSMLAGELPPAWRGRKRREDLMAQAVLARDRFIEDQHYVVVDGAVVIVDEGTGRSMPGRSWSYGLHQAVEAKAGVALTDPTRTLARLSFQNFFKLYGRLCGASGTLQNVDFEVCFNYRVMTLRIPPRRRSRMRVRRFKVHPDRKRRLQAVVAQVAALHASGRPVLVGTRSVADSEALGKALDSQGLACQVLNARRPEAEAEIIATAGEPARITVATNMAGRGTDIAIDRTVAARGGLCVIAYEPHESARVDWQLYGRAARQGQRGEVFPHAALDDELLTRFVPRWLQSLVPDFAGLLIRSAQRRAQRRAFRLRRLLNRVTRESRERLTFTDRE